MAGLQRALWFKRGLNPRGFTNFVAPGVAWAVNSGALEDTTNPNPPTVLGVVALGAGATVTYDNAGDGGKGRMVDTAQTWAVNQWVGYGFRSGLAPGLNLQIVSNTANTLTFSVAWRTIPGATSSWEIHNFGGNWWHDTSQPVPGYENGLASGAPYGN